MRSFTLAAFLTVVSFLSSATITQAQSWAWATSTGDGMGFAVAFDSAGNRYVAGSFSREAVFGTDTLRLPPKQLGGYVGKQAPNGTWRWVVQTDSMPYGFGITVNRQGEVLLAGSFTGAITLGSQRLAAQGVINTYVACLSPAGQWQWARQAPGHMVWVKDLCTDYQSSVYLTGHFQGTAIFGSDTLTSAGAEDVFVARLDRAGNWQWAVRAGGRGSDYGSAVATGAQGQVVVAGSYSWTAGFGTQSLTARGNTDIFAAQLSPGGNWQWATTAGGPFLDEGSHVTTDHLGNVYVAGFFVGGAIFGPTPHLQGGNFRELFVGQLNSAGDWQWAVQSRGSGNVMSGGLTSDGHDVYLLAQACGDSLRFAGQPVAHPGGCDFFVAQLTAAGRCLWTLAGGGSGNEWCTDLAVSPTGNLLVTGFFESAELLLGPIQLPNTASNYVASYFASSAPAPLGTSVPVAFWPLTLTPNPAHGTVRLSNLPPGATTAHVIDALGRTVQTSDLEPLTSDLSLQGLPPGLYVVRVGSASRRLVVE